MTMFLLNCEMHSPKISKTDANLHLFILQTMDMLMQIKMSYTCYDACGNQSSSIFWSSMVMLSPSRWQKENEKKSDRDRENVWIVTDEKEAAILHYKIFEVVISFHLKSWLYPQNVPFLYPLLSLCLSFKYRSSL